MFYSQRISTKKRRLANPKAFDQSWRTRRLLTVHCDIRDDARNAAAEAAQLRQRSRTNVEHRPSTPFAQSSFDFRVESVVPGTVSEPEVEDVETPAAAETSRVAKTLPRLEFRERMPGVREHETSTTAETPRLEGTPEAQADPQTTKDNSVVLNFVHSLHKSLEDDEDEDTQMLDHQAQELPPQQKPDHTRTDSVIPPPTPTTTSFTQRRRRRHHYHASTLHTAIQNLRQSRAELLRMRQERTMDPAEVSLRSEMHYRQQYLSAHKRESGTKAFREVEARLAENQRHLYEYKRNKTGVDDLPESVRSRMGRTKAGDEERAGDVMVEAALSHDIEGSRVLS